MVKKAFTLAEILITLGIIGVVAAITLPALMGNYKKQVLHIQFKAMYSDLNNAAKQFQLNHNGLSVYDYSCLYDKGVKSDITLKEFQKTLGGNAYVAKSNNTDEFYSLTHSTCDESGVIFDKKGRLYSMDNRAGYNVNLGPKVCVDINGVAKPNTWGADRFVFVFTADGYVKPYLGTSFWGISDDEIPLEERVCKISSAHPACSYFAISDVHPSIAGKSYWKDFVK